MSEFADLTEADHTEDVVLEAIRPVREGPPLHSQVYRNLKEAIQHGDLRPGAVLPSEAELARRWDVARGTLRRALVELAQEGLLDRRQGRGTTVAHPKIHQYLGTLNGFTEEMRARDLQPRTELLRLESISPSLSLQQLLGLEGGRVWRMVRLRYADDLPVALETCYVAAERIDRFELEKAGSGSVYAAYRARGMAPRRAIQRVEAIVLDAEHAHLLQSRSGDPAFRHERITYDGNERVIEMVESVYRGDRYSFQVDLRVMG